MNFRFVDTANSGFWGRHASVEIIMVPYHQPAQTSTRPAQWAEATGGAPAIYNGSVFLI